MFEAPNIDTKNCGAPSVCKPNREAEAAQTKKLIDGRIKLRSAIEEFLAGGCTHAYNKVQGITELYGALSLELLGLEKRYESTLKLIEEER